MFEVVKKTDNNLFYYNIIVDFNYRLIAIQM